MMNMYEGLGHFLASDGLKAKPGLSPTHQYMRAKRGKKSCMATEVPVV